MSNMIKKIIPFVLLMMFVTRCAPAKITTGVLDVKSAWARPAAQGDNGAVYFMIENGTENDDSLISASSDVAGTVELHLSQAKGDHMSMHHQETVNVAAGDAVVFSPGGLHVMLVGLTRDLKAGDTFKLTLVFENAGEKKITVTVQDDLNDD